MKKTLIAVLMCSASVVGVGCRFGIRRRGHRHDRQSQPKQAHVHTDQRRIRQGVHVGLRVLWLEDGLTYPHGRGPTGQASPRRRTTKQERRRIPGLHCQHSTPTTTASALMAARRCPGGHSPRGWPNVTGSSGARVGHRWDADTSTPLVLSQLRTDAVGIVWLSADLARTLVGQMTGGRPIRHEYSGQSPRSGRQQPARLELSAARSASVTVSAHVAFTSTHSMT